MIGFLRAQEADGRPFSSIEMSGLINWAQRTRTDETVLELLVKGLAGVDWQGPELVFSLPSFDSVAIEAAEMMIEETKTDVRAALIALCATRWAAGELTEDDHIKRFRHWVLGVRARATLLDAFLSVEDAAIDYDQRGRIVIYPPENTL